MLADHQRGRFADIDSEYPLTAGERYVVVGMGIWENVLSFLVRDDGGRACFAPAGLFECGEHKLPEAWWFALRDGISASGTDLWTHPCAAVWGYDELVRDPGHVAAIEEGDEDALGIFFRALMRRERELAEEG